MLGVVDDMGFYAPASHLQSEISRVGAIYWEEGMKAFVARPETLVKAVELLVVKASKVYPLLLERW